MHESFPDTISFGLDNFKFLEIVVECLRMHRATCTSQKDYQLDFPSLVLSCSLLLQPSPGSSQERHVGPVLEIRRVLGTCASDLKYV